MGFVSLQRAAPIGATDPIASRLDAASQAIDGHFLALGQVLADAVEGLSKLVGSLDQVERTLDPTTVAQTTEELRAAADDLLTLPERHAERSSLTRRLAAAADRLADDVDDMRRTLAYLRVFAINIKITAGGIASAGGEFGDFAQEIGDCIERGRAQLDSFEADLKSLRGEFKAAFDQEQDLVDQCGKLLPAVPDGLMQSATAMAAYHQRIGQVAAEVAGLVRGIQKKTGAALGALQIGDITRQRIEHASEGLTLLNEMSGLVPDQRARITAFVYRLLEAQLQAAADDFHRDVPKITEAMGSIATDAQDILRLRDLALGRAKTDDKGFLLQLETRVGQAQSLVADMAGADHKALAMAVEVSRSAEQLSEQIIQLRTIKTDVQYMALNTTLKCGRLGDAGKPLAVIAVELRLHAGHMDSSAEAALAALADLTAQASQMAQANSTGQGRVGGSLDGVALRLRTLGDNVETELVSLAREGEAVVDGLRGARRHLDFEHRLGGVIEQATKALSDGAGATSIATAGIEQPLSELLAKIAKRYTMAQEREVHHRIAGQFAAAPAEADTSPAAEEADLDDVLF